MTYSARSGVKGRAISYRRGKPVRRARGKLTLNGLIILLVGICLSQLYGQLADQKHKKESAATVYAVSQPAEEIEIKPAILVTERFNQERVQAAIDSWSIKNPNAGVSVTTDNGNVLGEVKADATFFMASIYKLYVAYVGYQAIDAGTMNANEPFVRGLSREQCLDEMVRNSNSTCAENVLAGLGKANVQSRLTEYGLTDTSIAGLTTSSRDAAKMLQMIQNGEKISAESQKKLLASMHGQQYRNALAKGFAGLEVYNKVGFRDLNEYHDVAIVRLADGTSLIVSVLSKNTGNKNIALLAAQLVQATLPE